MGLSQTLTHFSSIIARTAHKQPTLICIYFASACGSRLALPLLCANTPLHSCDPDVGGAAYNTAVDRIDLPQLFSPRGSDPSSDFFSSVAPRMDCALARPPSNCALPQSWPSLRITTATCEACALPIALAPGRVRAPAFARSLCLAWCPHQLLFCRALRPLPLLQTGRLPRDNGHTDRD